MFNELEPAGSRSEGEGRTPGQVASAEVVESASLEVVVDEIGFERTKACVVELMREAMERVRYLPGWQADAIVRQCRELQAHAGTFGAASVETAAAALLDALAQNERE